MTNVPKLIWGWLSDVPPHAIALLGVASASDVVAKARTSLEPFLDEINRPLPIALVACLGLSGVAHLYTRVQNAKRSPIVVLAYPFAGKHFRGELVAGLAYELGQRGMPIILKTA